MNLCSSPARATCTPTKKQYYEQLLNQSVGQIHQFQTQYKQVLSNVVEKLQTKIFEELDSAFYIEKKRHVEAETRALVNNALWQCGQMFIACMFSSRTFNYSTTSVYLIANRKLGVDKGGLSADLLQSIEMSNRVWSE